MVYSSDSTTELYSHEEVFKYLAELRSKSNLRHMDPGVPTIIEEAKQVDHAGLKLAQILSQIPDGDIGMLVAVMRTAVETMDIRLGSQNHHALLEAVEDRKITTFEDRQKYFQTLFAACVKNANRDKAV